VDFIFPNPAAGYLLASGRREPPRRGWATPRPGSALDRAAVWGL